MTPELRKSVIEFARHASAETLERLAEEIAAVDPASSGLPGRIGSRFADPLIRHEVVRLLEQWLTLGSPEPKQFGESLRTAAAATRWQSENERLELVWSGPRPAGTSFRRSDEALLQVVRGAREQLAIVTFAAYRIEPVVAALREALARGVTVRFFGETEEASGGRLARDAAAALGRALANRVELYEWPKEHRQRDASGRFGLLHAKFALADGHVLFISSANLTEAAQDLNMEMGVLVMGGRGPAAAHRHLARLVAEGMLRRITAVE